MKIGRKGHQHTPDQLMRCWKPSELPIDFFGAACAQLIALEISTMS